MKQEKGITLIALVITIIVLLILAGITIATITGQDSTLDKAAQARNENEKGAAKDAATLLITQKIQKYYDDKYVKNNNEKGLIDYVSTELGEGETIGDCKVKVDSDGELLVLNGTTIVANGEFKDDGTIEWDESGDAAGTEEVGTITKGEYIILQKTAIANVGEDTNADDWIVLYDGRNSTDTTITGNLYAILADYLPNETRTSLGIHTELSTDNTKYNLYINSDALESYRLKDKLIDGSWNNLLDSKTKDKGINAYGALSWPTMCAIANQNHTHYIAPNRTANGCNGYYIASNPGNRGMYVVYSNGGTGEGRYNSCSFGVCPIAIIPADVKIVRQDGVLKVK